MSKFPGDPSGDSPENHDENHREKDGLGKNPLPQDDWHAVFDEIQPALRNFLISKLPQPADADDCLQAVSLAMLQNKTDIPPAARRAWLFRVASNEAALWWRKKMANDRVLEKQASYTTSAQSESATPRLEIIESADQIRNVLKILPESSQVIVAMRIQDGKTFQTIADELQLPLGTVLTRMRRAIDRIRQELQDRHTG